MEFDGKGWNVPRTLLSENVSPENIKVTECLLDAFDAIKQVINGEEED